ncbi:MAG TPA: hypothetical protein VIP98_02865 [Microlunatus sp.]
MDNPPQYYDIGYGPLAIILWTALLVLWMVGICTLINGLRWHKFFLAQIIVGAVTVIAIPVCSWILLAPTTIPAPGSPSDSQQVITCESAVDAARMVSTNPLTGTYHDCNAAGRRTVAEVGAAIVALTIALTAARPARRRTRTSQQQLVEPPGQLHRAPD